MPPTTRALLLTDVADSRKGAARASLIEAESFAARVNLGPDSAEVRRLEETRALLEGNAP